SAIPMPPGKRAVSRTPSVACAASFRARPTSPHCQTDASTPSSAPTTTRRENALTSGPRPRPSPKCCTSNVNPPPRLCGDDSGELLQSRSLEILQIHEPIRRRQRCLELTGLTEKFNYFCHASYADLGLFRHHTAIGLIVECQHRARDVQGSAGRLD